MKKRWFTLAVVLILSLFQGMWENTALETNLHIVEDARVPDAFDGLRIAQVSDFHNGHMGPSNEQVITALKAADPEIILLTGDLIDSRHTDITKALSFVRQAVQLAPVYYVSGNHEARGGYTELKAGLEEAGATILDNSKVYLQRGEATILLLGLQDPAFYGESPETVLGALTDSEEAYSILLCHRPELFEMVSDYADLVFSGHTHGGQIRIPVLGGLAAPGQGVFPKLDSGEFAWEESVLLLSRGVGNSLIPLRLGNRPEILVAELKTIHIQ